MAQHIRELMTANPVALPGAASVHEAACAMRDADIGDVIVIKHNQVCGIVTDRDIVVRMVPEAQGPATTTLPTSAVIPSSQSPPLTAPSRPCGSCELMLFAACLWSNGGRRGASCHSEISPWSGSRAQHSARSAPLPPMPNPEWSVSPPRRRFLLHRRERSHHFAPSCLPRIEPASLASFLARRDRGGFYAN